MRIDLWFFSYGEVFPRVGLELSLSDAPVKEALHLLEDTALRLRRQGYGLIRL